MSKTPMHTPNHDYSTRDMLEDTDLDAVIGGTMERFMSLKNLAGESTDKAHGKAIDV